MTSEDIRMIEAELNMSREELLMVILTLKKEAADNEIYRIENIASQERKADFTSTWNMIRIQFSLPFLSRCSLAIIYHNTNIHSCQ